MFCVSFADSKATFHKMLHLHTTSNLALNLKNLFNSSELQNFYDSVILGIGKYLSFLIDKEKPLELWFYKFNKDLFTAKLLVIGRAMIQIVVETFKPETAKPSGKGVSKKVV